MSMEDYVKAYRSGKKDYQARLMRGERPTLEVLDEILPARSTCSEIPIGLVQVPSELIVGTRTDGRSNAFSGNFMPLLNDRSEFAAKWANLSTSHLEEGIRDPIKAYEYMNRFYVEEGNKRVSVLKYFGAVSILANVIRVVPPRTEEPENVVYYEFMDYYERSRLYDIQFSQPGNYKKLQLIVKDSEDAIWTEEDRLILKSVYARFSSEFEANGGAALPITTGDAFLYFIELFTYIKVQKMSASELKELVSKSWEEFRLLKEDSIELKLRPTAPEKKSLLSFSWLLPQNIPHIRIGFVYAKTPSSSAWTYMHELGRLHLEQRYPDEADTLTYENATEDNIEQLLRQAIADGCNLIFTTSPSFADASVKAAISNPQIRILNCSLNTSHSYIRTYYARTFEAKFLLGAIAGAMAENDQIAYIGDYPIFGSIANINAFALGAKMINPRATVHLEWSSRKNCNIPEFIRSVNPSCISGRDMMIPDDDSLRLFGLYHFDGEQHRNLAMPVYHWGKFYDQLIGTIISGSWDRDENPDNAKAINYWWGMSARVVDILCSKNLPAETARLIDLLRHNIKHETFNPFTGVLYSQDGVIQENPADSLTPEEIVTMEWLASNVVGSIPKKEELIGDAQSLVNYSGVKSTEDQ